MVVEDVVFFCNEQQMAGSNFTDIESVWRKNGEEQHQSPATE